LERMASQWFFDRFSTPGSGKHAQELNFTRGVREQEWSFADRRTIALDAPIVQAIVDDAEGPPIPERQRRMAKHLMGSIPSVFLVDRQRWGVATFRDLATDRTFEVDDRGRELQYEAGYGGFGRLIPFEDGIWLRSPGMILFEPPSQEGLVEVARTIAELDMPPAIAIEAAISAVVLRDPKVPRYVSPSRTRPEAELRLAIIGEELARRGILPSQLEMDGLPDPQDNFFSTPPITEPGEAHEIDEVWAEYLVALIAMAEGSSTRPKNGPGNRKRAKKKPKKTRKGRHG
jgi:hypothetical protein